MLCRVCMLAHGVRREHPSGQSRGGHPLYPWWRAVMPVCTEHRVTGGKGRASTPNGVTTLERLFLESLGWTKTVPTQTMTTVWVGNLWSYNKWVAFFSFLLLSRIENNEWSIQEFQIILVVWGEDFNISDEEILADGQSKLYFETIYPWKEETG